MMDPCMYIYIYVHVHTHIYIYMCVCVCVFAYLNGMVCLNQQCMYLLIIYRYNF